MLDFIGSGSCSDDITWTLDEDGTMIISGSGEMEWSPECNNVKTVIIEDENGIDHIYGNLDNVNVKLYDYVDKNDLLGTASNNTLYLLFSKDGKYLDYKEFLK